MGKTRDLKKIRAISRTIHAKMVTIKDRRDKDLKIQKRLRRGGKNMWKNYTKKTVLNDLDNHDGVITHLEPDILECELKLALGSITMNKDSWK